MPKFRALQGLQTREGEGPGGAAILVNHSERGYQMECLRAVGPDFAAIRARPSTLYGAVTLFVAVETEFSREDAGYLQSLFLKDISRTPSTEGRRLYVVRGRTRRRRIRNESAVVASMLRCGYSVFDPAGKSVVQQAAAFARASMVVGFHGAGLANAVFCRAGTTLVEVCDSQYSPDYYRALAARLDLRYSRLLHCTRAVAQGGIAEDLTVDVDQLEAQLRCMI